MMVKVLLVTALIMLLLLYAMCVIAGRADERLREFEESDGK